MDPQALCLAGWLVLCSLEDLRFCRMHTALLLAGSILGILCHLLFQRVTLWEMLGGFAIGLGVLATSRCAKDVIGDGDALLLMATGSFLGLKNNLLLLWGSLLLVSAAGAVYLLLKRRHRAKIPFAPFVASAYLAGLLAGGFQ